MHLMVKHKIKANTVGTHIIIFSLYYCCMFTRVSPSVKPKRFKVRSCF